MKIAIISGSRSDRNALVMVRNALRDAGHEIRWISLGPEAMAGASKWALPKEPWPPAMAAEKALFWAGVNVNGFGESQTEHADLAVLHGDRHEVLAAAVAVNVMGVPIAHIGGGDITEGSQDDCFRHAITKLSHLHFASHQEAADRIIQMGEEPERVHVTGCPGIDMVMATPIMLLRDTLKAVGLLSGDEMWTRGKIILVLFHPNTLGDTRPELEALSVALARRTEALVLLGPNADAGSDLIRAEWKRLAVTRLDTVYHDNVEPVLFYSLLKHCDVLVGNSSAGYYEAPCFGMPVVNIGDRQKGRRWTGAVLQCDEATSVHCLTVSINMAMNGGRFNYRSLYGDGRAASRIADVINGIKDPKALLRKQFRHAREWCNGEVQACPVR